MAKILTEDDIEKALVKFLVGTGWGYQEINAMTADRATLPDNTGRADKKQCVLPEVLLSCLKHLNPSVPDYKLVEIADEVAEYRGAEGVNMSTNRELYELLRNGKAVEFSEDGEVKNEIVRFVNFDDPTDNDFRAVRQMWICGGDDKWRRPGVIVFVNGLPLVFIELKNADVKVEQAYTKNLTDYKDDIPNLFAFNQVCILSNASETRDERINDNAKRIVEHFVMREYRGKAMVVAVDRYTAVKYYNAVNDYWPKYRKELVKQKAHATTNEERDRIKRAIGYVKPDADGFVTIKAGPLTVVVYKTQVWYQKMPGEAPKDK